MNSLPISHDNYSTRRRAALVVEDEVLIRMDVADSLRELGWDVVETGNAIEALDVLRSRNFDLIVTDVHMPGGVNGIELARVVKQSCPGVVVIVMSGVHRPDEQEAQLVDAFVSKPVADIVSVVQAVVTEDRS